MAKIKKHVGHKLQYPIKELKRIALKSTDVVGWYLHKYDSFSGGAATIRGPWNRWVSVFEGIDPRTHGNKKNHMSTAQEDAEFVCVAMNNFIPLLEKVEALEKEIKSYKKAKNEQDSSN